MTERGEAWMRAALVAEKAESDALEIRKQHMQQQQRNDQKAKRTPRIRRR